MNSLKNKRLKKHGEPGPGAFKFSPSKNMKAKVHLKLEDLIKERSEVYGDKFNAMDCSDSDDYGVEGVSKSKKANNLLKSKSNKSKKNQNTKPANKYTVEHFFDDSGCDSDGPKYTKSKPSEEYNFNSKQNKWSYKQKNARKKSQPAQRKSQPKKKGGKKKKRTVKDFYDDEAESEGGGRGDYEKSGSDRYESDFICDDEDEIDPYLQEGTYQESEDEYFSKSENSSDEDNWSDDSVQRFEHMPLAKNDGRDGKNHYRYWKDEESYYLERSFKIHSEIYDQL